MCLLSRVVVRFTRVHMWKALASALICKDNPRHTASEEL
jgi:hypothetical protein